MSCRCQTDMTMSILQREEGGPVDAWGGGITVSNEVPICVLPLWRARIALIAVLQYPTL